MSKQLNRFFSLTIVMNLLIALSNSNSKREVLLLNYLHKGYVKTCCGVFVLVNNKYQTPLIEIIFDAYISTIWS